jgi:hypothetical protein
MWDQSYRMRGLCDEKMGREHFWEVPVKARRAKAF